MNGKPTGVLWVALALVGCGLLSDNPKTIVLKKDEHLNAQSTACLWLSHKCMDIDYAIDDMELTQSDLGLMIENDLACWDEWKESGCALLLEEVPTSRRPSIEIPEGKLHRVVIPQVLTPIKIPENPYSQKGKRKKGKEE